MKTLAAVLRGPHGPCEGRRLQPLRDVGCHRIIGKRTTGSPDDGNTHRSGNGGSFLRGVRTIRGRHRILDTRADASRVHQDKVGGLSSSSAISSGWWCSCSLRWRSSPRFRSPSVASGGFFVNSIGLFAAISWLTEEPHMDLNPLRLVLLNIPATGLIFGCRRLTFWILAGGDAPSDKSADDEDGIEDVDQRT